MKYLLLTIFLVSCGSDESRVITEQLPPPIPPVYRQDPIPTVPVENRHDRVKKLTIEDCLNQARRQYPWIRIQEGPVPNAMTQILGYRRAIVTMGYHLKQTVDASQFCLILGHELSHATHSLDELKADFYAVHKLRSMLRYARGDYRNRNLDRIIYRQYRWLKNKPRTRTHPSPDRRLRAMRKALKRADYY